MSKEYPDITVVFEFQHMVIEFDMDSWQFADDPDSEIISAAQFGGLRDMYGFDLNNCDEYWTAHVRRGK